MWEKRITDTKELGDLHSAYKKEYTQYLRADGQSKAKQAQAMQLLLEAKEDGVEAGKFLECARSRRPSRALGGVPRAGLTRAVAHASPWQALEGEREDLQ